MASALLIENSELKKRISDLEEKNMELTHLVKDSINDKNQMNPSDLKELMSIKHVNWIYLKSAKLTTPAKGRVFATKREGPARQFDESLKTNGKKMKNFDTLLVY